MAKPEFPFAVNRFYEKKEIWRKLGVAGFGGIRRNKAANFIVLFFNAPTPQRRSGRSHNIYRDYYEPTTGLYRYTGEGQKGDQKLTRGNLSLANAKNNSTKIHFFRQHNLGGLHEYLGEVEVESYDTEIQKDVDGKNRTAFVFWLRLISNPLISEEDAVEREIAFAQDIALELGKSKDQLENEIKKLSELITSRGPRKGEVTRSISEYKRFKTIVIKLKAFYDQECQICGMKHFETDNGVYSEAHHIIAWSVSHDDSKENLVVLCANCHRKFHQAKNEEKIRMYKQLRLNFPTINYKSPLFLR